MPPDHIATGFLYAAGPPRKRIGTIRLYTRADIDAHVRDSLAQGHPPGLRPRQYDGGSYREAVG